MMILEIFKHYFDDLLKTPQQKYKQNKGRRNQGRLKIIRVDTPMSIEAQKNEKSLGLQMNR